MTRRNTDTIVSAILLAVSLIWCAYVVQSIPPGTGGGDIGPRALPLLFGALLGLLSGGQLLVQLLDAGRPADGKDRSLPEDPPAGQAGKASASSLDEWVMSALVFVMLLAYGWLLRMVGFNLATFTVITLTMLFCLRDRSPVRIGAMGLCVTFGCWLVFGQLLDIPLATGLWINLG